MTSTATHPGSPASTTSNSTSKIAGVLLIAASVLAGIGASWLMTVFGWPDILDAPGAEALPAFRADEGAVRTAFYLLLTSSLLLIPAAVYLEQLVGGPFRPAARAVTAFGVLGGFAQLLGWVRWPVTVPHLSDAYAGATGEEATAIASSYDVLNRYAGAALGEHLGWLLQGLWAVGLAALLLQVAGIPRWFAGLGLIMSLAWLPMLWGSALFSAEWLAPVGSTISSVWYLWLLALGVIIVVRRVGSAPQGHNAAQTGHLAAR